MSKSKPIDVTIPALGESIFEVQISAWLKQPGQTVALDEPVLEIESDKATVEIPAPAAGVLAEVLKAAGEMAAAGEVVARITPSGAGGKGTVAVSAPARIAAPATVPAPAAVPAPTAAPTGEARVMPAARRILQDKGVDPAVVTGTGPGGRILKQDAAAAPAAGRRGQRIVPMTMIRRRIAERLVQSQQNAALLTTFNEIDMSRVIALRREHQEAFQAKYGVKLGFMSFFVRASVQALQLVPQLNAEIRGQDIVYHDYQDVGIAVGGGKGLVVPVLRDAETLDFGQIEQAIADLADRAGRNKLDLEELEGGTFTISNGGIYGSLMSTPIINPPQSGVLGLHVIQDRPIAVGGQVVIRPMMYVALTYDHRIVDGREAVAFLGHIKHCVEQPERLLLKV